MLTLRASLGIICFLLGFVTISGADFFTGTQWRKMDQVAKVFYVMGFQEGILRGFKKGALAGSGDEKLANSVFNEYMKEINPKGTRAQLVEIIDSLYNDPRNLRIPVLFVTEIAGKAMNGASSEEVERSLQFQRKQ